MAVATRMTADEFLARDWPRGTQLIRGEVVVSQPALPHQLVVGELYAALRAWTRGGPGRGVAGLAVDVRIGDDVYAPDVWWLAEHHRPAADATALERAPDLVAEVRSPSTWRFDIGAKRDAYEHAGVAELWLVDLPARSVIVYRRSPAPRPTTTPPRFDVALELAGGDELGSPLLPGFALPPATLFGR